MNVLLFQLTTFLAIVILVIPSPALGQGTMRGTVTDSVSHETLVGVNVFLVGTAQGSATDREGVYRIARIPSGDLTVRVSCIGYKTKDARVMSFGNDTTFNFQLTPDVLEGEEILITAQARGQIAAINQQINSKTIVNVISEEKIKELPDVNAAEAIGRLPGVSILRTGGEANRIILRGLSGRFTSFTIDGMKIASTDTNSRDLDLSTISQASLSGIELYKAITPDKDADAIAGSINFVTKKAPSAWFLRLDAKGNYNSLMDAYKQYDFALRYGERFFDDILGVQLSGNLERRNRSNERYDIDYTRVYQGVLDYRINDFRVEFTNEIRKRNGFGVLLDVATPDSGTIRINNVFNRTDRSYLFSTRNYPVGTGLSVTYFSRDREQEISTFNSSVRGDNYLAGLNLSWGLSLAQSVGEYPYDYSIDFIEPSLLDSNNVVIAGMRRETPPGLQEHPEQLIPFALNNYAAAYLNNAYYRTEKNRDKERTVFLNIGREYVLGDLVSGEVKIGAKYRQKDRFKESAERYAPYYLGYWQDHTRLPDGSIVPKNFGGTWFDPFHRRFIATQGATRNPFAIDFLDPTPERRNLFDLYMLSPIVNRDALRLWYDLNKDGVDALGRRLEYSNNPQAQADYYDVTERVAAAFFMNTLELGQTVTFIAGARVEREKNNYNSKYAPSGIGGFPIPLGAIRDTSVSYSEAVWLPNFHLNVRPTDFMSLRIAAYRALSRPDFNQRLIKFVALGGAAAGSGNQGLLLGNPGLRTAKAWNYEANTSFYGNTFGLVSVSAFYKEIDDLHHMLNGAGTEGKALIDTFGIYYPNRTQGTYLLTLPYNSFKPTKVWGFEFEHQMNFNFLPGLLKNIVLSYNGSLVRSETYIVSTEVVTRYDSTFVPGIGWIVRPIDVNKIVERKQTLEGQPELYGNISLGYDIGDFSGRISLFYQGEYNYLFSGDGQTDQVVDKFTRLDLAMKYQFADYLSIMLNVNNLANTTESISYLNRKNDRRLANTAEKYGLSADLGVVITL